MKKQILQHSLAIFIIAIMSALNSNATVWRVNNVTKYNQWITGNQRVFNDLQNAVSSNNVNDNDTLLVEGTNQNYTTTNPINISRPLVIIGPGYFLGGININPNLQFNQYSARILGFNMLHGSAGTKLFGLDISLSGNNYGVFINDSNISISRCHISKIVINNPGIVGNYQLANIQINQNYIYSGINYAPFQNFGVQNFSIQNNYIYASQNVPFNISSNSSGIVQNNTINGVLSNNSSAVLIKDNIFCFTNGDIIPHDSNSIANVDYNLFANIPLYLMGANNIAYSAIVTAFPTTGSLDSNWHPLATCWNCYNSSSSGGELGIFGGITPYILSGIPDVPTIYNLINYDSSILQNGQDTIHISTRTIAPSRTINRYEYFWNVDSGFSANSVYNPPFQVSDTNLYLFYLNVYQLGNGTYNTFFIRIQDNVGSWSHTNYLDSVYVNGNVGIAELENLGISISPNPISEFISISNVFNHSVNFLLYDAEGRLIEQRIISEPTQIDMRKYSYGLYTAYFIKDNRNIYSMKLIKQ